MEKLQVNQYVQSTAVKQDEQLSKYKAEEIGMIVMMLRNFDLIQYILEGKGTEEL